MPITSIIDWLIDLLNSVSSGALAARDITSMNIHKVGQKLRKKTNGRKSWGGSLTEINMLARLVIGILKWLKNYNAAIIKYAPNIPRPSA